MTRNTEKGAEKNVKVGGKDEQKYIQKDFKTNRNQEEENSENDTTIENIEGGHKSVKENGKGGTETTVKCREKCINKKEENDENRTMENA